jgi:crossover junction endodeoxyribonuclease RusA
MTIITVTLPFPDGNLSPNSRDRWGKIEGVQLARASAKIETMNFINDDIDPFYSLLQHHPALEATIDFYPPSRRRADVDNMVAKCKSYLDGIFDALGVDDNLISQITARRHEVVKGGKVTITIDFAEA